MVPAAGIAACSCRLIFNAGVNSRTTRDCNSLQAEGTAPTHYFEVDFQEVTKRKAAVIASRDVLHRMVGSKLQPQDVGMLLTHVPCRTVEQQIFCDFMCIQLCVWV